MNKLINQSNESVYVVGMFGSHASNKEEFNLTLPKLLDKLHDNWCRGGLERHTEYVELEEIMIGDNVIKCRHQGLHNTAYYYFQEALDLQKRVDDGIDTMMANIQRDRIKRMDQ